MMVKLGTLRRQKEKMSFREWASKHVVKEGRYPVRIIFPPKDFPSFSLIFEDIENNVDVKMSIKKEIMKEAMKTMGVALVKSNLPSLVVVVKNGEFGLDLGDNNTMLEWRGSYWCLSKKDDIPF